VETLDAVGHVGSDALTVTYAAPLPDKTWTGSISSDWNTAGNWSPSGVPAAADDVAVNGGFVTMPGGANVSSIALNGGVLNWTGGTLGGGQMTIASGAVLKVNGTDYLNDFTINNSGVIQEVSGILYLYPGTTPGVLNNLSGGLFDIQGDFSVGQPNNSGTPAQFNNVGTLLKSAATNTATVGGVLFNDTGAVSVTSGALQLSSAAGGSISSGQFTFANDARARIYNLNLSGNVIGSGAGALEVNNGVGVAAGDSATLNFGGGSKVLWTGGQISGPGTLYNAGAFEWQAGSLSGTLTNTGNAFTITGTQFFKVAIQGGVLNNTGTIAQTGNVYFYNSQSGTINNLAGGVYDLQGDSVVATYNPGQNTSDTRQFNNAGTLRRSAGSNTATVGDSYTVFTDTGTVNVTSGILQLNSVTGGIISGGQFTFANNAVARLGYSLNLSGNITGSGEGVLELNGGFGVPAGNTAVLNFGGLNKVQFMAGFIDGPGSLVNVGAFEWVSGSLIGSLTNTSPYFTLQDATKTKYVNPSGVLINSGTITAPDNSGINSNGVAGTFFNLPGALYDFAADGYLSMAVNNSGTIRKSAGGATSSIGSPFRNTGTVEVLSGTLALNGHVQTAGTTLINGGNLSGSLNFQGGELTGIGSISGSVVNGAVIRPGLPGLPVGYITILGSYTQLKAGRLEFDIAGLIPSIQHDRLDVSGNVTLDGTLKARFTGPFNPTASSVFNILFHGSRSGQFSTMDLDTKNGQRLTPVYNATGVSLATTTQPRLLITSSQFNGGTGSHRLTIQFNANVSATLDRTDFVIQDLTTGATIPASATALDYNAANNTATLTFPAFPNGVLPTADYMVTLPARSVKDPANNELDSDFVKAFSAPGDITAPSVTAMAFAYDSVPQKITLRFSENVSASLSLSDVSVINVTTGVIQNPVGFAYDLNTDTVTFTFGASLPDGNYRATIAAGGVTDAAGNPLPQFTYDFFQFAGDANHDRNVGFNDLVTVAQNYNGSNKTWAQGDFNGDGNVDFADLVILAQHYNTTLPEPATPAASPATTAAVRTQSSAAISAKSLFSVVPVAKPLAHRPRAASRPGHR
jgi:hypothetical protein